VKRRVRQGVLGVEVVPCEISKIQKKNKNVSSSTVVQTEKQKLKKAENAINRVNSELKALRSSDRKDGLAKKATSFYSHLDKRTGDLPSNLRALLTKHAEYFDLIGRIVTSISPIYFYGVSAYIERDKKALSFANRSLKQILNKFYENTAFWKTTPNAYKYVRERISRSSQFLAQMNKNSRSWEYKGPRLQDGRFFTQDFAI